MGARPDTLVIIPTYCERDNLPRIVPAVLAALACEVLVVDDLSPDGTGRLADELAAADERVGVLHRYGAERGLGSAYRDGFARALASGHRFVVQMDADFSHDPKSLPALRSAAEQADVAIGSRWVEGGGAPDWTWRRRLLSRGGSAYARWLLGLGLHDVTGGFKCWRAAALSAVDPASTRCKGFAFQIEMNQRAVRAGLRVVEVPIRFCDRRRGRSKMSTRIFLEGLLAVWRIRRARRP